MTLVKFLSILFMLTSFTKAHAQAKFTPQAGWSVVNQEEKDLNDDKKPEQIIWLKQSKAQHAQPERLIILLNGKTLLDYKDKFCGPHGQNGYGNAEACSTLKLEASGKSLALTDTEKSSSDQETTQTHTYEWTGSQFVLVSATYIRQTTGQMQETDFEKIELDYKKGTGSRLLWAQYGVLKTIKEKRKETCPLENLRKDEGIHLYNGFNVADEFKCKG